MFYSSKLEVFFLNWVCDKYLLLWLCNKYVSFWPYQTYEFSVFLSERKIYNYLLGKKNVRRVRRITVDISKTYQLDKTKIKHQNKIIIYKCVLSISWGRIGPSLSILLHWISFCNNNSQATHCNRASGSDLVFRFYGRGFGSGRAPMHLSMR